MIVDIEPPKTVSGDYNIIKKWNEILLPINIPLISQMINIYLAKIWPFRHLTLSNFIIARLKPKTADDKKKPSVSIIIPARNEAGNIENIFKMIHAM